MKKILFMVETMGGGVFTYVVDLSNELINSYDVYIAYVVRKQIPDNFKEYFDKCIHLIKVKSFERSINFIRDMKAFFKIKRIDAGEYSREITYFPVKKENTAFSSYIVRKWVSA